MAFFIYWRIRVINFANTTFHGITSTHVENTYFHPVLNLLLQDHLHLRGEHSKPAVTTSNLRGSSPHTWRTHAKKAETVINFRIISTYVENTGRPCALNSIGWDHLHIRGEHLGLKLLICFAEGSSPHTWRTHRFKVGDSYQFRIISTYVENTASI